MYRPLILVLAVGRGEGTAGEGWRRMSAINGGLAEMLFKSFSE